MARLNTMASKSKLMVISITYNGKAYTFNLYEELQVDADTINRELKKHASSYAFLTQLRNHLSLRVKTLELNRDKAYDKAYVIYKSKVNPATNKPYTDDMAKSAAKQSKYYINYAEQYILATHDYQTLQDCVKAFETRKDLIQSLSANIRSEK